MKSTPSLLHWRLLLVLALVLNGTLFGVVPVLAAPTGSVVSSATPSNATPGIGDTITVTININMSGVSSPDNYLGSYTGSLAWNPAILTYSSYSGAPPTGFTGVVNTTQTGSGLITFNGASASGATGNITILIVTFTVTGAGTTALDLGYTAMAAATTFGDLLPILTVNDGSVSVTAPPTCYALTRTHSGSGADPVASPANSDGCPAGQYVAGAVINLTASPAAGWTVGSWTGTSNNASTSTTNQVTMPASAHTVGVNYVQCYALTRTHSGSGADPVASPTNSPGCSTGQYVAGAVINLTASPAAGWTVGSWTGTNNNASTSTTNQATMPASAHTVGVNYVEAPTGCPGAAASVYANNPTPTVGQQIVVTIWHDMTGVAAPNNYLGSFTGSLTWNSTILQYVGNSGYPSGWSGVINEANVGSGQLLFNGAKAEGDTGAGAAMTITFNVVAAGTSALDLSYSAMASALTFCDLLPGLTVTDGTVVASGAPPTCYALTLTHTGNGSDPVASPINSAGCQPGQYVAGAVINLTASPAAGWTVGSWTGTSNNSSTSTTNQVTMPASAHTVGVNYVQCYALTRTHTGNGTDPVASPTNSPGCSTGQYVAGAVINLTASPAAGWTVGSWTGTNNNASTSTTNQATMPASAHTVGVNYVESGVVQYMLTTAVDPAGAGWMTPWEGEHMYPAGTVINVTAYPYEGYQFDHWSGACTGSGSCSVTMNADKRVTAHFTEITYNLTVAVNPVGGGTTNPPVGVHAYPAGAVVNVTATPAAGYEFAGWSGACTGSGSCSVTMDGDKTVTANFVQITHNLTVAVNPVGAGTTNPSVGVHVYPHGTVVNVTATPAIGYEFVSWSGACTGSGSCSVTMDADKTVTANFVQVTHNLTVAVNPVGAGTTNPSVGVHVYPHGTVVNVTATPAAGYAFSSWSGACTGSGSCSVTMDADKTVTANFVLAAAPDLSLTKEDGGEPVGPGDTISYLLTYQNAGANATGVVITEIVPANTTFNAAGSTAGWVCQPNGNAGSTCTFDVGQVASGGGGSVTFAVTVDAQLPPGVTAISNTATIADDGSHGPDPTPANNTVTVQTTVRPPAYRIYLPWVCKLY